MSRKERKYLIILGSAILLFIVFQFVAKQPYDWTITLQPEDKDPFGTYILHERITDFFEDGITRTYATPYELQDSSYHSIFILAENFYPGEEDLDALLEHAANGNDILISSFEFSASVGDTLGFYIDDYSLSSEFMDSRNENADSLIIQFVTPGIKKDEYTFPVANTYSQFGILDSTKVKVIAINDSGAPVMIQVPVGEGSVFLNCTPLIFTNIFILQDNNSQLAAQLLSFLEDRNPLWIEYFQTGRMESGSPLRVILSDEALSWFYYLTIAGLILFFVFEAKRRQRIIPVITPLRNTTLDFVRTISTMYYEHQDHKNIAEKRINFFLDRIRKKYFLQDHLQGKALYEKVAAKSGHSLSEVEYLFSMMYRIRSKTTIDKQELKELNTLIENFSL
jgi:hypothetical protein